MDNPTHLQNFRFFIAERSPFEKTFKMISETISFYIQNIFLKYRIIIV